jgi:menaquinone-dependent protoporphyrinogen oxidase
MTVKRVLVAYASKRGSTAEIARAIANSLKGAALEVDLKPVADVSGLDPYDAVVLGSAVYIKRWRGDAKRFLHRHAKDLAERPLWVFSSGPVGDPAKDDPAWMEPRRILEKAEDLGARDHVVFGGSIPEEPHGFMEKSMADDTAPEYRDRRNWHEIRAWAERIASELGGSLATS